MSFDDLMLWLVTAMSLTAVVFLVWTLAALIRSSGAASFAMESDSGQPFSAASRRHRGH
jgi:hypothetical protein